MRIGSYKIMERRRGNKFEWEISISVPETKDRDKDIENFEFKMYSFLKRYLSEFNLDFWLIIEDVGFPEEKEFKDYMKSKKIDYIKVNKVIFPTIEYTFPFKLIHEKREHWTYMIKIDERNLKELVYPLYAPWFPHSSIVPIDKNELNRVVKMIDNGKIREYVYQCTQKELLHIFCEYGDLWIELNEKQRNKMIEFLKSHENTEK